MGMLMDRWGARRGFTFAIVWWSIASAMHGLANSVTQFGALRFWLGTGECGNFSGSTKVVGERFPPKERALGVGIFNGGTMVGSVIAPPLVVWLVTRYGWRTAFVVPSALGFLWVLLWLRIYRPNPHGFGPAAAPPSSRQLLRLRQTWAVILCRTLAGPVMHLYVYWLPLYLFKVRGFSLTQIGLFAWVPFLFADIGSIGGGWFSGWLMSRGFGLHEARKLSIILSTTLTAASMGVALVKTVPTAFVLICTALFGFMWMSATVFAVFSDLFPENAVGRVTGLTGVGNGASSLVLNLATGIVVDHFSYVPVFAMAGLLPAAGALVLFSLAGRIERVKIETSDASS